jgi:hypothetical protein
MPGHRDVPAVIGAGWSRTGTFSLSIALDLLGFGPCQHMASLLADPALARAWSSRLAGNGSWADVLAGWGSAVDWPTSAFVLELAEVFPAAKVVLTTRPVEAWHRSFSETILADAQPTAEGSDVARVVAAASRRAIGPRAWDGAGWKAAYVAHEARVRAAIHPDRLLVYSVAEGWGPLCRFLGVPVPLVPFPRTNGHVAFHERLAVPQRGTADA